MVRMECYDVSFAEVVINTNDIFSPHSLRVPGHVFHQVATVAEIQPNQTCRTTILSQYVT